MYGGRAGEMMASVGLIVVGVLFPPAAVVGTMATLIGAAYGGYKAHEAAGTRKREETLARLTALLQDLMRKAQRHALMQFDEIAARLEPTAEGQFQLGVDTQCDRLRNTYVEMKGRCYSHDRFTEEGQTGGEGETDKRPSANCEPANLRTDVGQAEEPPCAKRPPNESDVRSSQFAGAEPLNPVSAPHPVEPTAERGLL